MKITVMIKEVMFNKISKCLKLDELLFNVNKYYQFII
jgi:hypothetical protein